MALTQAERDKKWRLAHPERAAARQGRWRRSNPKRYADVNRRGLLKHRYGLTIEEYNQMLAGQGGVCAICKRPPKIKKDGTPKYGARRLAVDHFHGPGGKIRGLLCDYCNRMLVGMIESLRIDPMTIVDYLRGRSWDSVKPPAVGPEDVG